MQYSDLKIDLFGHKYSIKVLLNCGHCKILKAYCNIKFVSRSKKNMYLFKYSSLYSNVKGNDSKTNFAINFYDINILY